MTTETLTPGTPSLAGTLPLEVRMAQACAREPVPATPAELLASLQTEVPELAYATARSGVSYQLAESVHADLMGAFDYLPAKDLAVLRDWYNAPYSV